MQRSHERWRTRWRWIYFALVFFFFYFALLICPSHERAEGNSEEYGRSLKAAYTSSLRPPTLVA